MRLGDRIAVMRDGKIVQLGTAEDILVTPANDYVASFTQDVDRTRVLTAGAIMTGADDVLGTTTPDGKKIATLDDFLAAAPAVVLADAPIVDLFTPCSLSTVPVAVADKAGKAIGAVRADRLLAALGEDGDQPAVPAPRPAADPAPADKLVKSAAKDAKKDPVADAPEDNDPEGKVSTGA
jgi:glycine betaine/proline transport system ATP-binding protein